VAASSGSSSSSGGGSSGTSSSSSGSSSGSGGSSGNGSSGVGGASSGNGSSGVGGASSGGSTGGGSSGGGGCPSVAGVRLSINAGGPASDPFRADGFYSGGSTYSTSGAIDTSLITCDPPPPAVFQTERYGEFTYTLPNRAPGTAQAVSLYFEESFWTTVGQRTFDVAINGKVVLSGFDILAEAGAAGRAIVRTFSATADANGKVTIQFTKGGADNPKVCGITVTGEGAPPPALTGPCDLYEAGGTPCVAAHSTVRALYGQYAGALYQVKRASDGATKDVPVLGPGSFADPSVQDAFCAGTSCIISIIYDQSPRGNHLTPAPGGSGIHTPSNPVDAAKQKLTVGGHPVYAAYFEAKMGYRNNSTTTGLAKGDDPESMYMVTSGRHYNAGCCFDYGNAETTTNDDGEGTMEALYFGTTWWGRGGGDGPWVMADLENGVWAGDTNPYAASPSITYEFVTAMLKGRAGGFALRAADAQAGAVTTLYEGRRPAKGAWGGIYDPMRKQGAIILGVGGDNSNDGVGTFFEGAITTGYASEETEAAVQANIVEAGYGR
jgi:hypothetical protein